MQKGRLYKLLELINSHIHVILSVFAGWIISRGIRMEDLQLITCGILIFATGIATIIS